MPDAHGDRRTRPAPSGERVDLRAGGGERHSRAAPSGERVDLRVARLAARQDGFVHHDDAIAAGLTDDAISGRLAAGRWHRWHRQVYAVGHLAPAPFAGHRAASLAVGDRGTLGFAAAAHLLGFGLPPGRPVDVIVAPGHRGRREGLRLHRCALTDDEVTRRRGMRVTTADRTLMDLAAVTDARRLERLLQEAFATRATTAASLRRAVEARRGFRGRRALTELLDVGSGEARSQPERRLFGLVVRAGLPRPLLNARVGPWTADLYWPDRRVVVEVDGFGAHSSPWAQDRDRRKDLDLRRRGLDIVRFTARQVDSAPEATLLAVAQVLGEAGEGRTRSDRRVE